MAKQFSLPLLLHLLLIFFSFNATQSRPASFEHDFYITWSSNHVKPVQNGTCIQLLLDQSSGSGFASKRRYLFGRVSMKIKLVQGDSAGTVTAFYVCVMCDNPNYHFLESGSRLVQILSSLMASDVAGVRDEVDFEFLGNRTGQPYTVQTNVYARGKGDREQRVKLWFDPTADFHTYSILWNRYHILFLVDEVPIRVYKNNEARGVPYPKAQTMGIYSTLWEADDWATRGGLEKIDWTKAPFLAYYKDFDIDACAVPGPSGCTATTNNWWDGPSYRQLDPVQARRYHWVRMYHMIYDYCTDKARYPVTPAECFSWI